MEARQWQPKEPGYEAGCQIPRPPHTALVGVLQDGPTNGVTCV